MKMILLTAAALAAAPALAQTAPTTPAAPTAPAQNRNSTDGQPMGQHRMGNSAMGQGQMPMRHHQMFPGMSEDGRKALMEAMRSAPEDRAAVQAARDRVAALVGAEKLDVAALKRAMDDERRQVDGQHSRQQAAMLAAIQKLSVADRQAFAADVAKARANMAARAEQWRTRRTPPARPGTPG